ncbi:Endospore coat-associated protein YheD [compost metagenome]
MIGILYPRSILLRLIQGKYSFERPSFYLDAAIQSGEEVIFFSLLDINWREGVVLGWNGKDRTRMRRQLPSVIINRTRTNHAYTKKRIHRLKQAGSLIFNERSVVSKLKIHRILSQNPKLLPYLPTTELVTRDSVKDLLARNTSLFLKPSTASIGNGIIRISRLSDDTIAEINVLGRTKRKKISIKKIVKMVQRKRRDYLVQQGISLMTYKGNPVDFRVSIQKDGRGCWQYSGMVGKVAKKGAIVTNLHCGGHSLKAADLFKHWGWNGPQIEREVAELGLSIAETLDHNLPHIADLGLDIALDECQHPWFIEANFRDLRVTFRQAGEKEKWRGTFVTPLYYAAYLNKQIKGQDKTKLKKQDELAGAVTVSNLLGVDNL